MPIPSPLYCPVCGLSYSKFKTGFSFGEIVSMLWVDDPDPARWRQKRRRSILGFWHQLKLEMWQQHCHDCEQSKIIGGAEQYRAAPIGY